MSSRALLGDARDRVRQREQVLRLAEQRVRRHLDRLERQAGNARPPSERRLAADQMNAVPAIRQRMRQLGGDDAAAADRRVTHHADVHGSVLQQARALDRLADDDALRRRRRRRARRTARRGFRSAAGTSARSAASRPRPSLAPARTGCGSTSSASRLRCVVRRHIDDERRRRAVVDEVVADPLGPPRLRVGLVAAETAPECRDPQHAGWRPRDRDADRPSTESRCVRGAMAADQVDGRADHLAASPRCRHRATEILAPRARRARAPPSAASALPLFARAVARQLAARQIAQADAMARRGVPRNRAAEADFDVVGMRAEDEQIDRHPADYRTDAYIRRSTRRPLKSCDTASHRESRSRCASPARSASSRN